MSGAAVLARVLARRTPLHRVAASRLAVLAAALEPGTAGRPVADQLDAVLAAMAADDAAVWLAQTVLGAALPTPDQVLGARRATHLDGASSVLAALLSPRRLLADPRRALRRVTVTDAVVVDLHHTSRTELATGIQRVARQTAVRWAAMHDPVLVGWTSDLTALRPLDPDERATALHGAPPGPARPERDVLVPWRTTVLLPELAVEAPRTARLQALAASGGGTTGVIVFDLVPITAAETTAPGMSAGFASYLAAVRECDRVTAISVSVAEEYRAWGRMLGSVARTGPHVTAVPLPVEAAPQAPGAAEELAAQVAGEGPLVLVVGSHEPRKNHLAVLHAAELVWRRGVPFRLLMVGGNAWGAEQLQSQVARLQQAGRPVHTVRAMPERMLWAAYRSAHVVLFPSLYEGFGLPVAEALAAGTPVITSDFGSTAEIAAHGGAVLVDPRDDHAIAAALERVLTDPAERSRLAAEAAAAPSRTWDEYAAQTWSVLVEGR